MQTNERFIELAYKTIMMALVYTSLETTPDQIIRKQLVDKGKGRSYNQAPHLLQKSAFACGQPSQEYLNIMNS